MGPSVPSEPIIRLATPADAEAMLAIYAPIVRETPYSLEWEPPTLDQFRERISSVLQVAPWLVCEAGEGGDLLGYTYAGRQFMRDGYRWSLETSIYVHAEYRRTGVARALYTALLGCLRVQGYYNVTAGITLPNPPSVALHEALGFQHVGTYPSYGYKHGVWYDVGWWQLALREHEASPRIPDALARVAFSLEWRDVLARACNSLGDSR